MEHSTLKEELVKFIAEILCEAADRLADRLEHRLRGILRDPEMAGWKAGLLETSTPANTPSRFMSLKQFGAYFSMKPTAAYKMLLREKPPSGVVVRLGMRRIRVDIPAFEKWLASKAK